MDDSTNTVFDDSQKIISPPAGGASIGGKETEAINIGGELPLTAVGQETELPKEVISVGVHVQPANIPIPQSVLQMGVKPRGHNVSAIPSAGTIVFPLTDDQIILGMRQGPTTSWRWLAQWCIRRLKQFRLLQT